MRLTNPHLFSNPLRHRRINAPLSLVVLGVFLATTLGPVHEAWAQAEEAAGTWTGGTERVPVAPGDYDEGSLDDLREHWGQPTGGSPADGDSLPGLTQGPTAPAGLPTGGNAVSPQATALPSGPATNLGMGESFSAQLSTGTVSYSIPFGLLPARAGVQPQLALSYSSAGGWGLAGHGWHTGSSAITRQSDRGLPQYDDRTSWHPEQDRFTFGSTELVPVCTVDGTGCLEAEGALVQDEVLPTWADGWQYFRGRIDSGFLRFFWSPDHRTWRVQSQDGSNFEMGVPLDGTGDTNALQTNPSNPAQIYRWHLSRQYDCENGACGAVTPNPVNSIVYRYFNDGEALYLSDIFDTSPAATPTTTDLSLFAHHTHLEYEARPDIAISYRTGWKIEHRLRLLRVDVTSKPFEGSASAARELVRRYHLSYDPASHKSLLVSLETEGSCKPTTTIVEGPSELLPETTCPRMPPMTFEYSRVQGPGAPLTDSLGYQYEPFSETINQLPDSPPYSLDQALVGLADVRGVNGEEAADGLPDVLVTAPSLFDGKHGVYRNGLATGGAFGFETTPSLMGVVPAGDVLDADVLTLNNPNVVPLDLDADGVMNLVHMPFKSTYSVFRPEGGQWVGRAVQTASGQDVKIDFTTDARNTSVMDVNGDGLVDVVFSGATEMQTFYSLGRYPGGDDQFGSATLTSNDTASISNDPVTACLPWSGSALRFSDPDVRVGDMNGDGLPDLARVRSGQILYWPGRGNGFWGTGPLDDCTAGNFAQDRHIQMANAPHFGSTAPGTLLLSDVNADGLPDMIEIRNDAVDIYLNDNGQSWTNRHTIFNTPFRPSASNYVRVTDIDGSGTPDILWGRAFEYQYIDLTGGEVPNLLTKVHNGLGATRVLEYDSTANLMRQAAAAGNPWQSYAPTNSTVLVRATMHDNLANIGRPAGVYAVEYSYRDPVYDGRQREFRGFREAEVTLPGDADSPTSTQRTTFLLGECPESMNGTSADVCGTTERWRDNWREALKGLPVMVEGFDEQGVYKTTEHTTYELRQLYSGLDGRRVVIPLPVEQSIYAYDTGSFDASTSSVTLDDVQFQLTGITPSDETRSVTKRATSGTARIRARTLYDDFGNIRESTRDGCIEGCPEGVDEGIVATSVFALPTGDDSGWLYREEESYIQGTIDTTKRNHAKNDYNSIGKLTETRVVLSGTVPLRRSHVSGGGGSGATTAADPADMSGGETTPVDIVLSRNTYDSFGQVTFARGPNGRCSESVMDTLYSQLTVEAKVHVGDLDTVTDCGDTELSSTATYDRGLGAVLTTSDPNGQPASFAYDGFGRITSATFPNPLNPDHLADEPSMIVSYELPIDPVATPYTVTSVSAQDGPDPNVSQYHESWSFTDGLGRTLVTLTEQDQGAGDQGDYLASGHVEYSKKGSVIRQYEPWFHDGTAASFDLSAAPTTDYKSTAFDAFGRPAASYRICGDLEARIVYHALSEDVYDAADDGTGTAAGTYVTSVGDGHGRGVRRTVRVHVGQTMEQHHTVSEYQPSGEITKVTQSRSGSTDVLRWLRYDTLGRLVLNVEPNSSPDFTTNTSVDESTLRAWRYAYNDAGDIVGVTDARGCGVNYHYDTGGRLVASDRSPCLNHHAVYTPPNLSTGDGTETFYLYDSADSEVGSIQDAGGNGFAVDTGLLLGRITAAYDLGAKTVYRYDALGRGTGVATRMVKPGLPASSLSGRFAPRWYIQDVALDAADRVTSATTGATKSELLGAGNISSVSYTYDGGGTLRSIGSSYGTLLSDIQYNAKALVDTVTLGDGAATQRSYTYDACNRVDEVMSYRAVASHWSTPPVGYTAPTTSDTAQLTLEYYDFAYDDDGVGLITEITDARTASEWPGTAKPVSRTMEYDDLYRLTKITYSHTGGTDTWKSPFDAENNDATRIQPSPHVDFAERVTEQEYVYDHLGNLASSKDDVDGFWDRSTGDRTHGSAATGPQQVTSASNRLSSTVTGREGDLSVAYDVAGNITDLIVRRDGSCLPSGASCWQRFHYEWDEVGQIVRARRWDLTSTPDERSNGTHGALADPLPSRSPDAELVYAYSGTERALKTAVDPTGDDNHTVYVFGGYELRSVIWDTALMPNPDYDLDPEKVHLSLPAGMATARVVYSQTSLPTLTSADQHVFLELADHLGSTTYIIDYETGELVELATYMAYGATDTDYRPDRWDEFREEYRFGGKEEDIEVGLQYFGARFYSPYLTVWMSPDPVTIHDLGSDGNPYSYVAGSPLMGVDPDGRELISLVIGVAVAATVSFTSSTVSQRIRNGKGGVDFRAAGISAGISGAAALAGGVVGSYVGDAVFKASGSVVNAAMAGGSAGGITGSGTGYLLGSIQSGFEAAAFARALGSGAFGGFMGGGIGSNEALGDIGGLIVGSVAGTTAGTGAHVAFGGEASGRSFALSIGSGVAGALAEYGLEPQGSGTSVASDTGRAEATTSREVKFSGEIPLPTAPTDAEFRQAHGIPDQRVAGGPAALVLVGGGATAAAGAFLCAGSSACSAAVSKLLDATIDVGKAAMDAPPLPSAGEFVEGARKHLTFMPGEGKTASDSSKNERHGDGGRRLEKAKREIADLEKKLASTTDRKEKIKIKNKIQNIRKAAQRAKKGETHSKR